MSDRAGKFFLKQRGAKGIWQISWYEDGQTRCVSTHTADAGAARAILFSHALEHDTPVTTGDDQLAAVIQRYYSEYASRLPSAHHVRTAMRDALEFWDDPNVSSLDRREQMRFVTWLREKGLSDWTVQGRLTRLWAAMNWARRDNPALVVPPMVTAADWKPLLPDREQTFSLEELAALFNAAERHERWRRFMVLAVGTASRVSALTELTWPQVDLAVGCIRLNPDGRRQTKKRRATVPLAPTLAAELTAWERSAPEVVGGDRWLFGDLAKSAGVQGGANVIRHTVRTWLAKKGVPDSDADLFMGHKGAGSHTGARYTHLKPEHLAPVKAGVEALYAALAPKLTTPLRVSA